LSYAEAPETLHDPSHSAVRTLAPEPAVRSGHAYCWFNGWDWILPASPHRIRLMVLPLRKPKGLLADRRPLQAGHDGLHFEKLLSPIAGTFAAEARRPATAKGSHFGRDQPGVQAHHAAGQRLGDVDRPVEVAGEDIGRETGWGGV